MAMANSVTDKSTFNIHNNEGKLYLVGTPIGNLEDMTFRAVRVLKEVDLIAAEDTRNSRNLLQYFDIHTPMASYHEHNEEEKSSELLEKLQNGTSLAVITDAGMPGISDPGYRLVVKAWEAGVEVIPVPGPTAMTSALVSSGFPTDRFAFEGFLPRKSNQRRTSLQEMASETRTLIFYEAPHRLVETLEDMQTVLGSNRMVLVARELTKKHEEKIRGTIEQVLAHFTATPPKGEIVIILAGNTEMETLQEEMGWESMTIVQHIEALMDAGLSKKQAIKEVAQERNLPKSQVYQEAIQIGVNES